jgi:sugar phosphate isomerase/epimerase
LWHNEFSKGYKMANHVLGVQLFTVREFCKTIPDIAATLKKIAAIGYRAVQVSGMGPIDPKELAALLHDNGLAVAGTHMPWKRFMEDLDNVIAEHKLWNCNHAAIGSLPKEYYSLEGTRLFLSQLAPVAKKLQAKGIDFSYHNHNIEFIKFAGQLMLDMLMRETSPDVLKMEIDTYWIQAGGGDPARWIRQAAGRIPLLHLKDYAMAPGETQPRMAAIGEGNLDWPGILAAAKDAGVQWYLVEQDNCYGRDPFDCLTASYRNLNQMGLA